MPFDMHAQIEQWRRNLLDTSKRNRLVSFKTGRGGGIQLIAPKPSHLWDRVVVHNAPLTFVWKRDLIDLGPEAQETGEAGALSLYDPDQTPAKTHGPDVLDRCLKSPRLRSDHLLTDLTDKALAAHLARLDLRTRTSLDEQGVATLYLAFGFLRWYETPTSQEEIRSPLLLVPVRLERDTIQSPWSLQADDDDILPNHTLVELLAQDFRLKLPVPDEETSEETDARWRQHYFDAVQQSVARHDARWRVLDEAALGIFSFQKLAMWEDLGRNRDRIAGHDLCRAIAGDPSARLPPSPQDLPRAQELDQRVPPEKTFHILDADSSQHEAIEAAKRGASLVLDGPPGTGKSQTIANIIAECLGAGKTVLFVSEKTAALEVVYRRLQDRGLADFCLACHSHKANKREVVQELGRCLELAPEGEADVAGELQQLSDVRRQLNAYVRELHTTRHPLGKTVYQVHGELAQRAHQLSRSRCPIPGVLERDGAYLRQMMDLLARLPECRGALVDHERHPWRGCRAAVSSLALQDDVQHHFTFLKDQMPLLLQTSQALGRCLLLNEGPTFSDWRSALENARRMLASPAWWDSVQRQEWITQLRRWKDTDQEIEALRGALQGCLRPQALDRASAPLAARAASYRTSWSRWLPSWWSLTRKLKPWFRNGLPRGEALLEVLQKLTEYHARCAFVQQMQAEYGARLLVSSKGTPSRTKTLTILQAIERSGKAPSVRALLEQVVRQAEEVLARGFAESWRFLTDLFDPAETLSTGWPLESTPLANLSEWLAARTQDANRIHEWLQFREVRQQMHQAGVAPLLSEVLEGKLAPEQAAEAFHTRFLSLWRDAVYEQVPALRQFSTDHHERLIQQFRDLDRRAIRATAGRIRGLQLSRKDRPRVTTFEPPSSSELGRLLREVHKKRRHLPLRKLFAALPNLLLQLKPCVMMSPLAVSTYFENPDICFDLVIFDEASQVRPHDAIGAIYRGRSLVVAGDQKQLPPTSFFERVLEDGDAASEDQETALEDFESILDVCCTLGLPRRRLRWHYRSRREGLIAFSNQYVYDNELVTFPSVHDVAGNPAIAFEYVPDGRWKAGASGGFNAVEARRTAELVLDHFRQHPDESLGVIAFSQRQQMRILDELEQLRNTHPDLEEFFREGRDEPFFVKNLENVQGDERDVLILGIGYGPDETGRVSMRFGPLNQQGGERRLNVAVTRARRRMVVVSSLRAQDIDLSRTSAVGVKLLRTYLDYAERGTEALRGAITGVGDRPFDSPFEQEVYEELTRRGLTVHRQVGCSSFRVDLAIVDPQAPGRYLLGVECDGATYHSAATARDRDRLRQEVLESLGWRICRIWSTDWLRDRAGQVQRVLAALEKVQRSEPTASPPRVPPRPAAAHQESPPERPTTPPTPAPPPPLRTYPPPPDDPTYASIDDVPDSVLQQAIFQTLASCGATEVDDLISAVARQLGFKRAGSRIQIRVKNAITKLEHGGCLAWNEDGRVQIVTKQRGVGS